jgi:hypothetical protein
LDVSTRLVNTTDTQLDLGLSALLPARWWAVTAELAFDSALTRMPEMVDEDETNLRLRPVWTPILRLYLDPEPTLPEDFR